MLKFAGFSFIVLLLMLDPFAQPDSWLWEREKLVLPTHKSNCFSFTQTTMLDSEVPCVDDFQLKFPICSHQRMQTTNSSTLHFAAPVLCFTPILSSMATGYSSLSTFPFFFGFESLSPAAGRWSWFLRLFWILPLFALNAEVLPKCWFCCRAVIIIFPLGH